MSKMNDLYKSVIKAYDTKNMGDTMHNVIHSVFQFDMDGVAEGSVSEAGLHRLPSSGFLLKNGLVEYDEGKIGYVFTAKGKNLLSDIEFVEKFRELPQGITESKMKSKYSLKKLFEANLKEQRAVTRGNNIGYERYWGPPDRVDYSESLRYEERMEELSVFWDIVRDIEKATGIDSLMKKLENLGKPEGSPGAPSEKEADFIEEVTDDEMVELLSQYGWSRDDILGPFADNGDSVLDILWNYQTKQIEEWMHEEALKYAEEYDDYDGPDDY